MRTVTLPFAVLLGLMISAQNFAALNHLYTEEDLGTLESILAPLRSKPDLDALEPLVSSLRLHAEAIRGGADSSPEQTEHRFHLYFDATEKLVRTVEIFFERLGEPVSTVPVGVKEAILREVLVGDRAPFTESGLAEEFSSKNQKLLVCFEGLSPMEEVGRDWLDSMPFRLEVISEQQLSALPKAEASKLLRVRLRRLDDFLRVNYSLEFWLVTGGWGKTDFGGSILLRLTGDGYVIVT